MEFTNLKLAETKKNKKHQKDQKEGILKYILDRFFGDVKLMSL